MKTELVQAPTEGAAQPFPAARLRALAAKGWQQRLSQGLVLLGFAACLSILGVLLAAAVPKVWGYNSFIIYSSSMEPTISVGSLVVGQPVDVEAVKQGDIIIFRAPGDANTTITHRVVGVREDGGLRYFQTKGDAVNGADPEEVQLQGQVYRFAYELPYLGYFVAFTKSPLGIVLLLVLPAMGLLAMHWSKNRRPEPQAEAGAAAAPPES